MYPQPQTISPQLITELIELASEKRHNPFILRGYKKKAETLRKADPFSGYLVLGMIATLEKNSAEMHNYYRRAIKLNSKDSIGYRNYAVSLGKLGYYSEYFDYAQRAYNLNRGDLSTLEFFIDTCLMAGKINQAKPLLEAWDRLCPKASNPFSTGVEKAIRIMVNNDISPQELEAILEIAISLLQKRNIYIHQWHFRITELEGKEWIQYIYELDEVTPTELIELEEQLDKTLCQFFPRTSPQRTETVRIEYMIEEPELDEFLSYMEEQFQTHPEDIMEVDQEQLVRIASLIGERK